MPTIITPISPFFGDGAVTIRSPPPFPPMLTDQLELFGSSPQSCTLTDNPSLSKNNVDVKPPILQKNFKAAPYVRKAVTPMRTGMPSQNHASRSESVASSSETSTSETSTSETSSSDLSSESSADSLSDEVRSELSDESKIPKPPGEPGRPGRGGYNLENTLGWNQKAFIKLKKLTHRLVDEHLDVSKCVSAQKLALIRIVQEKVCEAFLDLENYQDCWPVNDIIMMRLKYTSQRARRQELEMAAGRSKRKSRGGSK